MIVAIDGPAASGKSTVARALAARLGLTFLDTGAMYRAVTLAALERGIDPDDGAACARLAEGLDLCFDDQGRIEIDGEPGEPRIRSREVDRHVSVVAAHPPVRRALVAVQRAMARGGAVAEGRDTTTVVFPEADHKFFLIASPRERARRRAEQEGRPDLAPEYEAELERRDGLDRTRADSPLVEAHDAVRVDTDGRTAGEVVEILARSIRKPRSGAVAGAAEPLDEPLITRKTWTWRVVMGTVHLLYSTLWPTRVVGRDKVPSTGRVVIVSNHASFLDIPLVAKAVLRRHVAFVARSTLAAFGPLAFVMRNTGAVLIERGKPDRAALRRMLAHLAADDALAIFPEGTRSSDGKLLPPRKGALLAARLASAPIVPCAIRGTFRAWPRSARFPRPGRLAVAFGDPIDPAREDALEATWAAIAGLLGDALPQETRPPSGADRTTSPSSETPR